MLTNDILFKSNRKCKIKANVEVPRTCQRFLCPKMVAKTPEMRTCRAALYSFFYGQREREQSFGKAVGSEITHCNVQKNNSQHNLSWIYCMTGVHQCAPVWVQTTNASFGSVRFGVFLIMSVLRKHIFPYFPWTVAKQTPAWSAFCFCSRPFFSFFLSFPTSII